MSRDNRIQTILSVDLSNGQSRLDTLPEAWTAKYLGARGVNARMLFDSVKAGIDAFGPENVLFFQPAAQGIDPDDWYNKGSS